MLLFSVHFYRVAHFPVYSSLFNLLDDFFLINQLFKCAVFHLRLFSKINGQAIYFEVCSCSDVKGYSIIDQVILNILIVPGKSCFSHLDFSTDCG